MRHPRLAALGVAALTTLAVAGTSGVAQADPANAKFAIPLHIVCDNGATYHAVTNGGGNWTPAHDLDSNAVLVPFAFGPITVKLTDPSGNTETETDPAVSKQAAVSNPHATTSCSFAGSLTTPDGFTFSICGTVLGMVTPPR